jgi:hypothetical protein
VGQVLFAFAIILIHNNVSFKFLLLMFKNRFNLRNVVAIAICLAGVANQALAQTFNYTDASGVTATYMIGSNGHTYPNGVTLPTVDFANTIVDAPTELTKWVLPETITHNGITYALYGGVLHGAGYQDGYVFSNLTELVLPKYMKQFQSFNATSTGSGQFPNLRKVTFGEYYQYFGGEGFYGYPLDSVIFKGTAIFSNTTTGDTYGNQQQTFGNNLTDTKIIIPCGTRELFERSLTNYPTYWNKYPEYGNNNSIWTTANLVEAECLNTLTVLSSDVSLGNARSYSTSGIITSTPTNTSATYSGQAELIAIAKAGKVFTGWSDGNTDNPRTVNVTVDITYTANFATCENTGVKSVQAASPLKVYPNPTNNTLNVQLEKFVNNGTLTLFNMSGKVVLSQAINGHSAQVNLSALGAGNYILRLVENGTASAGVQVIKN